MKKEQMIWTEVSRKNLFTCPIFSLRESVCLSPSGESRPYTVVDAVDWAIIIPVIENKEKREFLMVRQWRHGSNSMSLEFPGGVFERNEDPAAAAKREMREETGYITDNIVKLGEFSPNPAFMSNTVHVFLARDLVNTGKQELDDDEFVDIEILSEEEVLAGMGRPPYIHALMASALLLFLNEAPRAFAVQGDKTPN